MKLTKSFAGFSSALLGALVVVAVLRFTSWGRDTEPAFTVSNTPVNRDARAGTSYAPIVKQAAPSVVNIYSTRFVKEQPPQMEPFLRQFFGDPSQDDDRERTRKEESLGSGVIVSADGYVLTANHVVAEADEIKVAITGTKKEYTAKVIGKDAATDIAVLKIDAANLPAITLADSDQLEVGDVVLAIGDPFGLERTVTMGIVSALGRSGLGFNGYEDFIQTDAAINPGNSGGALVDVEGRLVGINTAIVSPSGGNNGIGLAVPINMARTILERLVSGGKITRGYLGVITQDLDAGLAQEFNLPDQSGALVSDVSPNSPADKAGIKSGDVILSANGKDITGEENLKVTISQLEPGSSATLKIIRNGLSKSIVVTLGVLPDVVVNNPGDQNNNPAPASTKTDALDGVSVTDVDAEVRDQFHIPDSVQGAIVTSVDRDSNSFDAGLRRADIIVEVNHQPVASAKDAVHLCKTAKGDEILVKIWRLRGHYGGTRYLSVDNTNRPK
jgi:serine protease Do